MTSAAPENPQTPADALPKSWDPSAVEADLYQGWVDAGYFQADATSDKPGYSIVLPPPNVQPAVACQAMGHCPWITTLSMGRAPAVAKAENARG